MQAGSAKEGAINIGKSLEGKAPQGVFSGDTKILPAKSIEIQRSKPASQIPFTVAKRNGRIVPFRKDRIAKALDLAFRGTYQIAVSEQLPREYYTAAQELTEKITKTCFEHATKGASLTVEGIQDLVEVSLMDAGYHDVARAYIVYREEHKALRDDSPQSLTLLRRDGKTEVRFKPIKIATAIESAFRATLNVEGPTPEEVIDVVNMVTNKVVGQLAFLAKSGERLYVELIQDEVERQLMASGYFQVAKDFILYRAKRAAERKLALEQEQPAFTPEIEVPDAADLGRTFKVRRADDSEYLLTETEIRKRINFACKDLGSQVVPERVVAGSISNFYDGIKESEVDLSNMMAARALIETDPAYANVAARLLLDVIYRETVGVAASDPRIFEAHSIYFSQYIRKAIEAERLSPELETFDLGKLARAMNLKNDLSFAYLGLQTIYDRYLIHINQVRQETPQIFWMRVAMGLALKEGKQKNERAIEFYNVLSQFLFVSSTPTLFNAGTTHPQLSSCYLSTVMDDLQHIFKIVSDDAMLSKWAGGLGNDWTNVRATGSVIKGTNGLSQGVIPFLKVANDTAVAVNQGGKRKGAMCAYIETWHLDMEDFLELRKNTGDERRRTHDMNTANWIPDLFMKRVSESKHWTLFNPSDVPDLHDLYGRAFEARYEEYERMTESGKIKLFKRVEAVQLWRKMLSMLFETGHPWMTFKDPSNIRSPQDHVGVVHSSNLCTEILLNTSKDETAVCNLGSINLVAHMTERGIDRELLSSTIRTAVRMLDNVIDINFYPTPEARNANLAHRPVGLGIMAFQDCLYVMDVSYGSLEAVAFADESMELISYFAILASTELAKERGVYSTYKGSKWERGILPIDSIALLEKERGGYIEVDRSTKLDWNKVREAVKKYGMRNSNTMAIAPTATISNICGATQSIEPMYKHLFVKSNLSGEFTICNTYLVEKLKKLGIWDAEMVDDLKYFDGSIAEIERIPDHIKQVYVTAFEIEPEWIIECASRRQKWIDMGQSLNLYLAEPSGKKLHDMYMLAWNRGLKTTYYLRSLGATQIEKSTTDVNRRGLQPRWMKNKSASSNIVVERSEAEEKGEEKIAEKPAEKLAVPVCNMEEGCESCQ